jgi:hypothetical protein
MWDWRHLLAARIQQLFNSDRAEIDRRNLMARNIEQKRETRGVSKRGR